MDSLLKDNYRPTETLSMSDLLQADRDNQIQAQHLSKQCGKNLNQCSYSQGYISQPVFACLTCNNGNNDSLLAGFCLGCSMNCHLDHNVIELWNKRNFRCDCGNKLFESSKQSQCLLSCKKDDINKENNYNHNFIGKYCYCNREYSSSQHTMHQCLNCQDWFHQTCIILNHLKVNPHLKIKYDQLSNHANHGNTDQKHDDNDDNDEDSPFFEYFRKILIPQSPDKENTFDSFICKDCAIKYDYFFVPYRWNSNTNKDEKSINTTSSKISGIKRNYSSMSEDSVDANNDNNHNEPNRKRRKLEVDADEDNQDNQDSVDCKRILLNDKDKKNVLSLIGGGLWFEDNEWINKLCQCNNCKQEIYNKFNLNWLFEDEGTTEDKNDENKRTEANIYNLNSNNLNVSEDLTAEFSTDAMTANTIHRLPRQQALDNLNLMMKGTDFIKQKLFEYVRKSNKKVVNADDIQNIFKNMT